MKLDDMIPCRQQCPELVGGFLLGKFWTQDETRHFAEQAKLWQLAALFRLSTGIAGYDDPATFRSKLRYPFVVKNPANEFGTDMLEVIRAAESLCQSFHYWKADALVEHELGRIIHAAGFQR